MSGAFATRARVAALPPKPGRPVPLPDFGAILAALPMPAVVFDEEDRFRYVNPAAELFFQLSFGSLAVLRLGDLLPPDSRLLALLAQVRQHEAPVSDHDLTLDSPRLNRRGVAAHGAPLPEMPGAVVLTLQDGSTAQMMNRQLNFLGAARGASAMAEMLAHEVKNPLSGIRGAAQLLEQSSTDDGDRELCQLIQDEADRIRNLVDRMDMFSDRPVELAPVNIHQVLDHVRRVAQTGFAAHLRITEEYDPSLPPVWGNRDQLVQILLNLVKNAAEAVDPLSGEIVLATAYHHGVRIAVPGSKERVHVPLQVIVRDNGPGIPEPVRATLFEPFVTTKRGGQGLGLALVAKLVADQGGLIECDSRPGRTIFRLSLAMPPTGLRLDGKQMDRS
ncbi:two-component system sensor histidine kinase NtrB [Belnapia rosea]|uniref:histidine kinase n=1 Tax=Belnapia rosea TaxID=938405 RepID=A0A1G6LBQ3_9PROT|nr:ATP-binding protein [Belnapia rosea]SDC40659.1 two-component system, NtrC family, nitrogen regulation sensor histidine kinase GlnL [Belnapia rosea]